MELCQCPDHDFGELAIRLRVMSGSELSWNPMTDHQSMASFHYEEGTTDHREVVAVGKCSRGLVERPPEPGEHLKLSPHVM